MIIYECTACGKGATLWNGSLFDCAGDEIILRHSLFGNESGSAIGECNNGAVTAYSTGIESTNNSSCYSSQLNISMNSDINNKTVTCVHVDGTKETHINTSTVSFETGMIIL